MRLARQAGMNPATMPVAAETKIARATIHQDIWASKTEPLARAISPIFQEMGQAIPTP